MVALRLPASDEAPPDASGPHDADGRPHADEDWLTLPQAACELGVSISTVRRLLRAGRLRNRIVPRRGGFKYLIYLPGNRHAAAGAVHLCEDSRHLEADGPHEHQQREINNLHRQIESLSRALSRALRAHQKAAPQRAAVAAETAQEPYARYRWLVRKRRWWPLA